MELQSMSFSIQRSDSAFSDLVPRYAAVPDPGALGVIAFEERVDGAVFVPARQLGPERLIEIWPPAGDGDVMFGSVAAHGGEPLETTARRVYSGIIEQARDAGFPYFLRMWNHVGG